MALPCRPKPRRTSPAFCCTSTAWWRPRLSILDAVVGMEGNGPSGGDPRPLGFLMASADAHALDAVLAHIWGLAPQQVFTLAAAATSACSPHSTRSR